VTLGSGGGLETAPAGRCWGGDLFSLRLLRVRRVAAARGRRGLSPLAWPCVLQSFSLPGPYRCRRPDDQAHRADGGR